MGALPSPWLALAAAIAGLCLLAAPSFAAPFDETANASAVNAPTPQAAYLPAGFFDSVPFSPDGKAAIEADQASTVVWTTSTPSVIASPDSER
jgi:hypothetical protein